MGSIIVVTGTPGAGKTTVLNAALDKIPEKPKVINYAEAMLDVGESKGIERDHDIIRKLPVETQRELQKGAAESIAETAKSEKAVVVDTHATINTPDGYLPGLPEWVVKALSPRTIILVEADAPEIIGRRSKDESRVRDEEGEAMINLQQEMNRAAAAAYATLTGATVKIIKNHDNGLDKAVDEFAKLFGRLK